MKRPSGQKGLRTKVARGRRFNLPGKDLSVGPISPPPERGVSIGPISPPPENFGQLLVTQAARMLGKKR